MKTGIKLVIILALSFSFAFSCIGYAQLSNLVAIDGAVNVTPPEGLYIISCKPVGTPSNATVSDTYEVRPTNMATTVTRTGSSWLSTGSVTYEITVFNNTDYRYTYAGIQVDKSNSQYNGNSLVNANRGITITTKDNQNDSSATFNTSDTVEPRSTRTFYATYSLGRNLTSNASYSTLVNYKFGVNIDSVEEVVVDKTFNHFEEILNDTLSSDAGYAYLTDIIDDKYGGGGSGMQWQATYIGNVTGSLDADTQKVLKLFGGQLSINIEDVETNVTLLIKREDVDGNTQTGDDYAIGTPGASNYISAQGCEWTLYMTTDPLQNQSVDPVIYAATFTCYKNDDGSLGEWFMLGDMYTGTADIIGYEGDTNATGSFQTDSWVSTGTHNYTVTDSYNYYVYRGNTIKQITQTTDTSANAEALALLKRAYQILDEGKYAGQAVIDLQEAFEQHSYCYSIDGYGNITLTSGVKRSQLVSLIRTLDNRLTAFDGLA